MARHPSDQFVGAMLGLACGDALGAPVEFLERDEVAARHGRLTEMVGGGSLAWAPGEWTDDTGMALAVAEGIMAAPGDPVEAVGERFLAWREEAKDVGGTIAAALDGARARAEAAGRDRPTNAHWAAAGRHTPQAMSGKAAGNGSLMRTLPVALAYPDLEQMLDMSARVSAMTHWDPQVEACCAVYCLWVREILLGSERDEAWRTALERGRQVVGEGRRHLHTPGPSPLPGSFWPRLERAPDRAPEVLQPKSYTSYVVVCLEAAVAAALRAAGPEEALVELVNLGGESDTMAAVCGGAVGARFGKGALPRRWLEVLHQRERLERAAKEIYTLRHGLTYGKATLAQFDFGELERGLLFGRNPLSGADVERLVAARVKLVVDLREEEEWNGPGRFGRDAVAAMAWCGVRREQVSIPDGGEPTAEELDRAYALIQEGLAQGPVYLHCRAGIERTGAVLAAWLARSRGLTYREALRRLEKEEAGVDPLAWQGKAVRAWLAESGRGKPEPSRRQPSSG